MMDITISVSAERFSQGMTFPEYLDFIATPATWLAKPPAAASAPTRAANYATGTRTVLLPPSRSKPFTP